MSKKIIALFLVLAMIIPTFSIITDASENDTDALNDLVICDLSKSAVIEKTGFPASNIHTLSGSFAMKWAGTDLMKNINLPITVSDFSDYKYLKLDVYSVKNTGSGFNVCLVSDNKETYDTDCYTADVTVDWIGWKTLILKLDGEESDFLKKSTPIGLNNISEMKLLHLYDGNNPVSGTELYFDKIYLSSLSSEDNSSDNGDLGNTYMIVDSADASTYVTLGLKTSDKVKKSSDVTLEWTGDKIKNGINFSRYPKDWSAYKSLVFEIYIANPTDSTMRAVAMSANPQTTGDDYYMASISCSTSGWQTVVLPFDNFSKTRTPLGWNSITSFVMWNTFSGVSVDPSTLIYIDRIYLSETNRIEFDNSEDFLIPSQSKEDFDDVISNLKSTNPDKSHPRLLFNKNELNTIKKLSKTDKFAKEAYEATIKTANNALDTEVQPFGTPDGKRLERTTPDRIPYLAMAYLLTDDVRYKDRLWLDIENICSYPNWNPSHFLDVGDFSRGLAYAYDWLYDDWTEEEKRIMRNAFVRNAFVPSIGYLRTKTGFAGQSNNWCEVINSGLGLAALAIGDEPGYEELCNEIINHTLDSLPKGLAYFAPDGACAEGPGYWKYAMQTFLQYDKSLFTSLGTDYGLSDMPGISNTGYFPISTLGPTSETFNFGDAGSQKVTDPCLFWLAERFEKKEFASYVTAMRPGESAFDLAFYRGSDENVVFSEDMTRDNIFRGVQEVATFRSSWNDDNALFVAFKGGSNAAGHNDLDLGDFILDAGGVRWFCELGAEFYEAPGMWDVGPDGGRWKYYRKNVEGQNTILINPSDKPGQNVYGVAPISTYEISESAAYGIVDLTDAYSEYAKSVKRGVGLINNRSSVIIQDEIKTNDASEIYTAYHTTADILIEDGGKTAILSQYGKKLKCSLVSPAGASFEILEATPLPGSADPGYTQYSNRDKKKLAVHLIDAVDPTVTVVCTPISSSYPIDTEFETIPLNKWDKYLTSSAGLKSLSVDGIELVEFSSNNTFYEIDTGIIGELSAVPADNTEVEFIQPKALGDTAFAVATSKDTGLKTVYSILFTEAEPDSRLVTIDEYEIVSAEASAVPEAQNVPQNTYDGNYSTKWAAEGEQWIIWDLGEQRDISSVMLAFGSGDVRIAKFDLCVSVDKSNWEMVYSGTTTKKTTGLEEFSFPETKARYIRLDSHGNNVNSWISLNLIKVPKILNEFSDVYGHWANSEIMSMYKYGFVKGISDTHFSPDSNITRAEFVTIISRLCSLDMSYYEQTFTDVTSDDWFFGSVLAAYKSGLIPGEMIADNSFKPYANITREEMASIIVRAYENKYGAVSGELNFGSIEDSDEISDYAKLDVKKALALRFVKGVSKSEFKPKVSATRAEAAVMLKRLFTQLYK